HDYLHAILDRLAQLPHGHETTNTAAVVLEIKKHVFVLVHLKAGHFSLDSHARQSVFEHLVRGGNKIADAKQRCLVVFHTLELTFDKTRTRKESYRAAKSP